MEAHDIKKHIVPQINSFDVYITKSNRNQLIGTFNKIIKEDKGLEATIKSWLGEIEIHEFLSDAVLDNPQLVIIIDTKTEQLVDATKRYDPIIVEFKIFQREDVGIGVYAVQFEPIISQTTKFEKGIPYSGKIEKRKEVAKEYTLESHLTKGSETVREVYYKLKNEILSLDNQIIENIKKHYIAFKTTNNFVEFVFQKNGLRVHLDIPIGELDDKNKIAEDCSKIGHWATGDTRFQVNDMGNVEYAMSLIKQSYKRSKQ